MEWSGLSQQLRVAALAPIGDLVAHSHSTTPPPTQPLNHSDTPPSALYCPLHPRSSKSKTITRLPSNDGDRINNNNNHNRQSPCSAPNPRACVSQSFGELDIKPARLRLHSTEKQHVQHVPSASSKLEGSRSFSHPLKDLANLQTHHLPMVFH